MARVKIHHRLSLEIWKLVVQVKSQGRDLSIQSRLASKAGGFGQSLELWLEAGPCTRPLPSMSRGPVRSAPMSLAATALLLHRVLVEIHCSPLNRAKSPAWRAVKGEGPSFKLCFLNSLTVERPGFQNM